MEIHVEAANADMLPKGCYVSVRVGDVLKQGRYEPQRAYNFPGIDRRRDVRIDVYQHVGTCLLAAEPDSSSVHDTFATSTHPDFPAMKFKVNVTTKTEEVQKSKTDRAAKMKGKAKEYLGRHRIEENLSEAVKALLKEQPTDPLEFICKYLGGKKEAGPGKSLAPVTSSKVGSKPMKARQDSTCPGPESFVDLDGGDADPRNYVQDVRSEMAGLLVEAAHNGQLKDALGAFNKESQAKAAKLRVNVGNALMAAADNGDFEKILKDLSPAKNGTEQLRQKAANLLLQSAENGDLRKALSELNAIGQPSPRDETRKKAAALLVEAADNGQLKKALEEIKGRSEANMKKLQLDVGNLLMAAMENGDLERAVNEATEEAKGGVKPRPAAEAAAE